ncbi:hypothetical protein MPL3365_170174 [Mesorhizobium plurifarium]|uniref:Uncharacterized protein n=1 Tax=Mesorhizobium plurifarium TaxID=69974 RepID=A0A090FZB5_MESPL|nr:hypothetical protein MPL3365_170174 [Mesorhizobium plurifarium]
MIAAKLDEAEEVGGDFVIARCGAPPLLELCEESLGAPAALIGNLVVAVLALAMAPRRDDRFTALVKDHIMQSIGIISAVGDHLARCDPFDQTAGRCHVVLLAWADLEADR